MKKNVLFTFLSILFFSVIGCSDKKNEEQIKTENKTSIVEDVNESNLNSKSTHVSVKENEAVAAKKIVESATMTKSNVSPEIVSLRKEHEKFLKNSPFKKALSLSKNERKSLGITPNKYYENEWELTMDPSTGKPNPQNIAIVRKQLEDERSRLIASGRTPGDASDNQWVERGPTDVGGRTRAIMFDPNDATHETVFAGGVSGGLWKNTNISNSNSTWTRVNIPENLAVSCITSDPANSNIFYVGTGESYVGGDVNGDGVWKSTDGGATWSNIFGGISGPTTFQSASTITVNSPAGIAGDYPDYPTNPVNFGSAITTPITQDLVLVVDNTAPTSDGCETITNAAALNGKIALIRRGSCTFVAKVKAAQDAGAVAVVMMNNTGGTPIPMGGTDATITIPSVMISQSDGDLIEAALGSGVNVTLNPTVVGGFTGNLVPGQQHINDVMVRDNLGTSEIYVAAGDTYYSAANAATYLGGPAFGLYKSVDGGTSWTEVNLPLTSGGNKHCPNDIEIGSDGKIWVSTTRSVVYGDGGGQVFSSTDGTTFTLKHSVVGYTSGNNGTGGEGARVEIEISETNPNTIYVLSELNGVTPGPTSIEIEVKLEKTTNGFLTAPATLALPAGNETRETTYGFTGQQAFYDLMIESDPTNDNILYVGGIDLYRSANGGSTWATISNWTTNVHSDQHAMAFKPGSSNTGIFGNDGGVYFTSSLSTANSATSRNKGFNVTQFYSVGVAPTGATGGNLSGDYFAAGAQDNGTQYFAGVGAGANLSVRSQGGDGAYTLFDQGADKYYISNYVYNGSINYRTTSGTTRSINNESASNGAFIAPMALDSNLDILYSDYSNSTPTYQIRRYTNLKFGTVGKTILTNALLTASPTALTVSPFTAASTKLFVGTRNGKLLRVTNANAVATWTDITGPAFVGSISDVEFGQSENEIFVTMHNYNVVSVWYTSNGGSTWQNKEGNLPDLPVKCILQNPLNTNEVIVGTELGVWYTNTFNTASPIWNQSYNGMSNVKVVDMDLRNDNTVFAATYGRGIFSGTFTSTVLSSGDFTNNKGVKVYPNPSNGVINLNIADFSGNLNIQLFDINGREVYKSNVSDFSIEKSINISQFQSGIYILKLEGENLSYSEKIILK
jgi:hypothetical protein